MEWVLAGSKLQRCRTAWLSEVVGAERILLLGEGHGRFLEAVRAQFPQAEITVLDSSQGMLREARKRTAGADRQLCWAHANVFEWLGRNDHYDLLVTNFFLDCFTAAELAVLTEKGRRWLKPGGQWLLADFSKPENPLLRLRANLIIWLMYRFFRVATGLFAKCLECPEPHLIRSGFVLRRSRTWDWGLLSSQWWERPV